MANTAPIPLQHSPCWLAFLLDWVVQPSYALEHYTFSLMTWNDLVHELAKLLKKDFDRLQDGRIETGLLTPDVVSGDSNRYSNKRKSSRKESSSLLASLTTSNNTTSEEKEVEEVEVGGGGEEEEKKSKAARRKEKDRQRRELKKLSTQQQDNTNEGEGSQQEGGAGGGGGKKELKLIARTTELFRSGCGADILMESQSVNLQGNRSRVCLSMFSAWWTCEDGLPSSHVTDITRHRFKTPLSNEIDYPIEMMVGYDQRYPIPTSILHEIPSGLHILVPNERWREIGFNEFCSKYNSDSKLHRHHDLEKLRERLLGRWYWIQVETIPSTSTASVDSHRKKSHLPSYLNDGMIEGGGGDGKQNQLPIPSYRESNLCPFEIRRLRLAKLGRALHHMIPCPLGCGEEMSAMSRRFHVRYQCPRRYIRCRYDFCGCLFPAEEQERHERTECELIQQRDKWLQHAERFSTMYPCPLCSELIPLRDLEEHQREQCEHRLIFCPYSDCIFGSPQPFGRPLSATNKSVLARTTSKSIQRDEKKLISPSPSSPSKSKTAWSEEADEDEEDDDDEEEEEVVKPQLPAHRLSHHLQYDCTSQKRKMLFMLVERARERHPYPRPWGLEIEL
eukprot:gene3054-3334_t